MPDVRDFYSTARLCEIQPIKCHVSCTWRLYRIRHQFFSFYQDINFFFFYQVNNNIIADNHLYLLYVSSQVNKLMQLFYRGINITTASDKFLLSSALFKSFTKTTKWCMYQFYHGQHIKQAGFWTKATCTWLPTFNQVSEQTAWRWNNN